VAGDRRPDVGQGAGAPAERALSRVNDAAVDQLATPLQFAEPADGGKWNVL
jgi:hypothetical protein